MSTTDANKSEYGMTPTKQCPKCSSPQRHLHPSLQHEGEVSLCDDPYHRLVTSENTKERTAGVLKILKEIHPVSMSPKDLTDGFR